MNLADDVNLEEFVMSKARGARASSHRVSPLTGFCPHLLSLALAPRRLAQDELSGADIKAMCTESGLLALRERRMKISQAEFRKAREYVMYKKKQGPPEGLYL